MIVKAGKRDAKTLAGLAVLMWDSNSVEELAAEFSKNISDSRTQFFLKYEDNIPIGFAQCQLRCDYVEGTSTTPVGYLEGIFIKEEYRRKGYARELLAECEAWAREKGCREFASDCEIDNDDSFHFHKAMNFKEANRIICFTKDL
ncbi:MAG: GNAT family N-acetyltransferase [Ruminococcaceae bacterium]|nr:GNAT family N-acetyltransferase [Oscillospiraceae bacterium]